ncbi:MAG: response regulator transcription factor [Flavobacteriales bacterium]|nr:response regulator transcription factor [Flavobacteriales bacterium]
MRIRTVLADHADLAIIGLRQLFTDVPRVQLVGEARDGVRLMELLSLERPDVVLLDHTALGFGAEHIRDGIQLSRCTRFVSITHEPTPIALLNALRSGVSGYIRKDCDAEEIVSSVLATADGERFFCGKVLEAIERAAIDPMKVTDAELSCAPVTLTEREYEVIALIADGLSYTRIADQLNLSAHTVTTHRKNIMQKLGVNNTAALVMYAVKHGLSSPNKFLFNGPQR